MCFPKVNAPVSEHMKAFFTSIGNMVGLISAGTTTQLAIDSTQADVIKGLGFGESLGLCDTLLESKLVLIQRRL